MSDILRRNATEAGVIEKIDFVPATWETADVGVYDIVLSAHAIYMSADFAAFVRKMETHARRYCYLGVRHIPIDGVIPELSAKIYGSRHDSPNFIIAYNALYQMGIYANVFIEEQGRRWSDETLENAFTRAKRHLRLGSDTTHDDLILATLRRRLVFKDGAYHWPDGMTSALVSWSLAETG